MKKHFVFFAAAITFSLNHQAQTSLVLSNADDNTNVAANQVIYLNTPASTNIKFTFDLKNTSNTTQSYNAIRYDMLLNNSALAYYCFAGTCYNDMVYESPTSLTLAPQQSASQIAGTYNMLTADLDEGPAVGTSIVKYTFINVANSADSIQVTLNYNSSIPTGIKEHKQSGSFAIAPNPSKGSAQLLMQSADAHNASVMIYNAVGALVKQQEIRLNTGANRIDLPVEQLSTGIYSVMLKDQSGTISRKLVIE